VIVAQGHRSLEPGGRVAFTFESPGQDGFGYRAVQLWPPGVNPEAPHQSARYEPSAAYRSSLTIRWQDGSISKAVRGRRQDS
jgi:CspA family cold shock protein